MKKEIMHFGVKNVEGIWESACGLPNWISNLWIKRHKVTCRNCRRTKIFRGKE